MEMPDPHEEALRRLRILAERFQQLKTKNTELMDRAAELVDKREASQLIKDIFYVICSEVFGIARDIASQEVQDRIVRKLSPASLAHVKRLGLLSSIANVIISIANIHQEIQASFDRYAEGLLIKNEIQYYVKYNLPYAAEERSSTLLLMWERNARKEILDRQTQRDEEQRRQLEELRKNSLQRTTVEP